MMTHIIFTSNHESEANEKHIRASGRARPPIWSRGSPASARARTLHTSMLHQWSMLNRASLTVRKRNRRGESPPVHCFASSRRSRRTKTMRTLIHDDEQPLVVHRLVLVIEPHCLLEVQQLVHLHRIWQQ